jgi:glycosyltransferase involved in cell wall biosynthesis
VTLKPTAEPTGLSFHRESPSSSAGAAAEAVARGGLRILVLNYEYPPLGGGASPVTAAVCRELAAHGNDVDVVTMGFRDLPAEEADGPVRVFRVKCLRSARHMCRAHELATYIPSAYVRARRLHEKRPYDLVHSHFFFPCGVVARSLRKKLGIPYVVTAHGSDVPGYNPDRFKRMHALLIPAWRSVVGHASAITSPSESLARLIRKNFGKPCDIRIIPNGIREDWMDAGVLDPGVKQRKVLFVSRLFERKGAQFLLEAMRGMQTGHDVHIVGEGPYRPALENLARGVPDRVTFHGWLENDSPQLAELYRTSSIFVFPSLSENFPISLLEAMISGMAIVATDLESCHEVLGDAARYIPAGDTAGLREHLTALSSDESASRDLGRTARQRVLDEFTWAKVGLRYHDFFARLVPSR